MFNKTVSTIQRIGYRFQKLMKHEKVSFVFVVAGKHNSADALVKDKLTEHFPGIRHSIKYATLVERVFMVRELPLRQ